MQQPQHLNLSEINNSESSQYFPMLKIVRHFQTQYRIAVGPRRRGASRAALRALSCGGGARCDRSSGRENKRRDCQDIQASRTRWPRIFPRVPRRPGRPLSRSGVVHRRPCAGQPPGRLRGAWRVRLAHDHARRQRTRIRLCLCGGP